MTNPTEFLTHYKQREKYLKEANAFNRSAVFDLLSAAGITTVAVEFDGEGDSGQIETVTARADDADVEIPAIEVTLKRAHWGSDSLTTETARLREAIETLCYGYLEQYEGGWENNDGAFGSFAFDVVKRTIELEFNGRYIDFSTHNYDV